MTAKQIYRARIKAGMSKRELAARAGVHPRTISRIEAGASPHPVTLWAIEAVLNGLATSQGRGSGAALPNLSPFPAPDLSKEDQ